MRNHRRHTMIEKAPKYECCECCEFIDDTTEFERCPLCGSHHVVELSFERLEEWAVMFGSVDDQDPKIFSIACGSDTMPWYLNERDNWVNPGFNDYSLFTWDEARAKYMELVEKGRDNGTLRIMVGGFVHA